VIPSGEAASPSRGPALVEVALAFVAASAGAAIFYRFGVLDRFLPGASHALIAALFLYLPAWLLRRRDLADYGLTTEPVGRSLALFAIASAIVLPLFAIGFRLWAGLSCAAPWLRAIAPGPCVGGAAALHPALRLPDHALRLAAAEVLVVALPEEWFFRGYLQGRLEEIFPARRRLLGAPVGVALVAASALFALCHLIVQGNPATLAVFFPGLAFGWMRARTNSIFAGTLFHALCNLTIEALHRSLFG
jgi:membrane protease YdiL (CAAX protease family)